MVHVYVAGPIGAVPKEIPEAVAIYTESPEHMFIVGFDTIIVGGLSATITVRGEHPDTGENRLGLLAGPYPAFMIYWPALVGVHVVLFTISS